MLQNAYFLAKIGPDTAENEQHFAEIFAENEQHFSWRAAHGRAGPGVPRRWRDGAGVMGRGHRRLRARSRISGREGVMHPSCVLTARNFKNDS